MDELLAAIVEHPEDDGPRFVWADAVGGERGELVVIQCDLARGGLSFEERVARRRRERELIATHGTAWAGLEGLAFSWQFRRGFVEAVAADAEVVLGMSGRLFDAAPLTRSLKLGGLDSTMAETSRFTDGLEARPMIARLFATPELARIDRLAITRAKILVEQTEYDDVAEYDFDDIGRGDLFAQVLSESPILEGLRGLSFVESGLTAVGVHALVASGTIAGLEALWIDNDVGEDAMLAIVANAPRLRSFEIHRPFGIADLAPRLPPLEELVLHQPRAGDLEALAASPAAATLRALVLHGAGVEFAPLARMRKLETLTLHESRIESLATVSLPPLRVLRAIDARRGDVAALAHAFGPQLELLDVRGHEYPELRTLVAGELRDGRRDDYGIGFL
jgi:uncharacterized protein (TIGR02996 family)